MIISFGKYKGKDMEDVPSSYLRWITQEHDDEDLVAEAEEELQYRTDHDCHKES